MEASLNVAWVLVAAFLVMFMQAGFALVETGLTRYKNVAHTMAMNFMIYGLGMLGFWICGFAIMFGGFGAAVDTCSVHFVSQAGIDRGALGGLNRRTVAVGNCRRIGKRDLMLNDALPKITVNADTYEVRADGELMTCEPAAVLPLAQRYFLF